MQGVVDLATDATGCHACFIYLLEDGQLTIRAASPVYGEVVRAGALLGAGGADRLGGPASHVSRSSSATSAMDDPRMKYVPVVGGRATFSRWRRCRSSPAPDQTIGVIVLHTQGAAGVWRGHAQAARRTSRRWRRGRSRTPRCMTASAGGWTLLDGTVGADPAGLPPRAAPIGVGGGARDRWPGASAARRRLPAAAPRSRRRVADVDGVGSGRAGRAAAVSAAELALAALDDRGGRAPPRRCGRRWRSPICSSPHWRPAHAWG